MEQPIEEQVKQLIDRVFRDFSPENQKVLLMEIGEAFADQWTTRLEEIRKRKADLEADEEILMRLLGY